MNDELMSNDDVAA